MQKIGILLPRSTYYETINFDLFNGLKLGLQQLGLNEVTIVTENIGFGTERQALYRSAERLLLEEDVDVVFAYIGLRSAQLLRPLFMSANKLLVVLDSGASLPQEWPVSPNILYHSLHNALGAWLSGKRASENFKEGGMVTGYYDGGYLHTLAITEGFVKNGGAVKYNVATGYRSEDFSIAALNDHFSSHPESCILSLFSGDFNQWFLRDLKQLFPQNMPHVYTTPFALEERMLSQSLFTDNISGTVSWSVNLDNPDNNLFCETMRTKDKTPNLFSLLGWEAALLTKLYYESKEVHKSDITSIIQQLKASSFNSPRGAIHFHNSTNTTIAPMYEADVLSDENERCKLQVTRVLNNIEQDYETMASLELNNSISGWFNSYTCN